jgi:glycosyltransferase involved in cell wall biosynthesis
VIIIDDGSTDPLSQKVFAQQQARYPQFRFLRQDNAGIGATRNRALAEARGEFFLTVDADNVARPDMVERFVAALRRNPDLSAISCYYLAFRNDDELRRGIHPYAYRPAGGPLILACCRNVYGDANALFRTNVLRAVGGYEMDRDTSWEDLEVFVKLVHAGHRVDVLPDYLFYYRHLESGWSRITSDYFNQQRVLRQFVQQESLPEAERLVLWNAVAGLLRQNEHWRRVLRSLRYRLANGVHALFGWSPRLKTSVRWLLRSGGRILHKLTARR